MSCLSTQSYIPLICLFNIQGTGGSTVGVVFAALPSHGARPLRSTEAEAEAVLAVALPLAVTTWALAILAVTTSAVLNDPCVVMIIYITCVLLYMLMLVVMMFI